MVANSEKLKLIYLGSETIEPQLSAHMEPTKGRIIPNYAQTSKI